MRAHTSFGAHTSVHTNSCMCAHTSLGAHTSAHTNTSFGVHMSAHITLGANMSAFFCPGSLYDFSTEIHISAKSSLLASWKRKLWPWAWGPFIRIKTEHAITTVVSSR